MERSTVSVSASASDLSIAGLFAMVSVRGSVSVLSAARLSAQESVREDWSEWATSVESWTSTESARNIVSVRSWDRALAVPTESVSPEMSLSSLTTAMALASVTGEESLKVLPTASAVLSVREAGSLWSRVARVLFSNVPSSVMAARSLAATVRALTNVAVSEMPSESDLSGAGCGTAVRRTQRI